MIHFCYYIYSLFFTFFNKSFGFLGWKMFKGIQDPDTGNITGVIRVSGVDHRITISRIKTEINTRKILKFTQLMRMGGVQL